jgi:hypothetical protein
VLNKRLVNPRQPLVGKRDRDGIGQRRMPQARPCSLHRRLCRLRTDGVTEDIPQHAEQMLILLDGKTFEAPEQQKGRLFLCLLQYRTWLRQVLVTGL